MLWVVKLQFLFKNFTFTACIFVIHNTINKWLHNTAAFVLVKCVDTMERMSFLSRNLTLKCTNLSADHGITQLERRRSLVQLPEQVRSGERDNPFKKAPGHLFVCVYSPPTVCNWAIRDFFNSRWHSRDGWLPAISLRCVIIQLWFCSKYVTQC